MRFSIVLASAFAALAYGATTSSTSASGSTTAAATSTRPLTPTESCVKNCKSGDVYCQAACVGVPYPGSVQMNQTTDCVAKCDQGDGSAAQNAAYAQCRNACISSYILTTGLGTQAEATATAAGGFATTDSKGSPTIGATNAAATGGSASGSGASGSATGSGSSGSASGSSTASGSGSSESGSASTSGSGSGSSGTAAASASSSGGAVNNQAVTYSGFAGLIMAILAL